MDNPVLEVRKLSITFRQYSDGFQQSALPVIHDLNLTIHEGELVAVVGASGSGKSLLAQGLLGILPYNATLAGEIRYRGQPLTTERLQQLRGQALALVPQSVSYLDPLQKIGVQLCQGKKDRPTQQKARSLLARYGLSPEVEQLYPFELSGGMARRVLIACALMSDPQLVIADEPTPGLHQAAAERVLGHFREIADQGAAVLLISHDLELALQVADRIVVFYAGQTVEEAAAADFATAQSLRHPYTKALWHALPQHGFNSLTGNQPPAGAVQGCSFAPRCPQAETLCKMATIPYRPLWGGSVRCIKAGEEV